MKILLVITRSDGTESRAEGVAAKGDQLTEPMVHAAEDLLHTLTTGERPIVKNFYELCAKAFGTTRDDAKERVIAAAYGMSAPRIEARSASRGSMLGRLAATRRERNLAHADVASWVAEQAQLGERRENFQAPGWDRFTRAEIAYGYAIRSLEAWLDAQEATP